MSSQLSAISVRPVRLRSPNTSSECLRPQSPLGASPLGSPMAGASGAYSPKTTSRRGPFAVRSALALAVKSHSVNTFVVPTRTVSPRGPAAVARKEPDYTAKLEAWVERLGSLADRATAATKSSCCYCGDDADKAQPCNLSCACDWSMAHDVWMTNLGTTDPEKLKENMVYVEQLYNKALSSESNNILMLADFALFLWKQKGDLRAVEATLNQALAAKAEDSEDRALILSLYSFFLSSTPPVSSSAHLSDYRQSMMSQ